MIKYLKSFWLVITGRDVIEREKRSKELADLKQTQTQIEALSFDLGELGELISMAKDASVRGDEARIEEIRLLLEQKVNALYYD